MPDSDEQKSNSVPAGAGPIPPSPLSFPWRVHLVDNTMVVDADGGAVAAVQGDYETEWTLMEDRARLISAAPDLLAALKEFVRDYFDNEDSDSKAMIAKARAAISKAEA